MPKLFQTFQVVASPPLLTVTFSRRETLNSINPEFMDELDNFCDDLANDDQTRAVILTGSGRGFCSGLDLTALSDLGTRLPPNELESIIAHWQKVFTKLENVPQVTFAAVNGVALGAGVELILACDFRIASSRALFGMPEVKLGIVPDLGGITRLTRMVGLSASREMILRGRNISAMEALRIGLVNRVADPGDMMGVTRNWAQQIATLPPRAVRAAKLLINASSENQLDKELREAREAQLPLLASDDFRVAITAAREGKIEEGAG